MPRSLKESAPQLTIKRCEDIGSFMVTAAPQWREKTKFGSAWLIRAVDPTTGEVFGFMFSANGYREQQCESLTDAFAKSKEPIGPLQLVKVKPDGGGNWFWDMQDIDVIGNEAAVE